MFSTIKTQRRKIQFKIAKCKKIFVMGIDLGLLVNWKILHSKSHTSIVFNTIKNHRNEKLVKLANAKTFVHGIIKYAGPTLLNIAKWQSPTNEICARTF